METGMTTTERQEYIERLTEKMREAETESNDAEIAVNRLENELRKARAVKSLAHERVLTIKNMIIAALKAGK